MKYTSKNKKIENKKVENDIILAIIPLIIIVLMELFFKICNGGVLVALSTNANAIIFSILMGYLIYAILISMTRRNSTAIRILCIATFLLLLINQIKIVYTGEPLYFSDINFLGKINDLVVMLNSTMLLMLLKYLLFFVILAIIFVIIIKKTEKCDFEFKNNKARIAVLLISIIIIVILFIPNDSSKNIYLQLFFNIKEDTDYDSYTTNLSYYTKYSLVSGMYGVMLNNRFTEPQNYNEQQLENILQESASFEIEKNINTPNIILVFSESFWDVNKLEEIEINKEVTANFNKLKQEGKCIELLSCTYGGRSENVAFELLTGGSMKYFGNGYIPIMSLYQKENSSNLPSIIKELKNNNYYSKIVFGKDYYNSQNAFQKIGFDEYIELKQTIENTKGKYISDEYITDLIIEELENKTDEKSLFYMAETIQNHMPYTKDKYQNYDMEIESSNLNSDMNNTLLAYVQGVYDADKQLGRLYEYIKEYNEPTVLIFLGDHLPYLYTEKGKNVIDYLDYFNTSEELESTYRKYNTQALILSNYDIDWEEVPQCLSNNLLLTYIINQMNIDISDYYKWLYSTINDLPASNTEIGLDKYGNKYNINNFDSKMQEIYHLKEMMQYKFFVKTIR